MKCISSILIKHLISRTATTNKTEVLYIYTYFGGRPPLTTDYVLVLGPRVIFRGILYGIASRTCLSVSSSTSNVVGDGIKLPLLFWGAHGRRVADRIMNHTNASILEPCSQIVGAYIDERLLLLCLARYPIISLASVENQLLLSAYLVPDDRLRRDYYGDLLCSLLPDFMALRVTHHGSPFVKCLRY